MNNEESLGGIKRYDFAILNSLPLNLHMIIVNRDWRYRHTATICILKLCHEWLQYTLEIWSNSLSTCQLKGWVEFNVTLTWYVFSWQLNSQLTRMTPICFSHSMKIQQPFNMPSQTVTWMQQLINKLRQTMCWTQRYIHTMQIQQGQGHATSQTCNKALMKRQWLKLFLRGGTSI